MEQRRHRANDSRKISPSYAPGDPMIRSQIHGNEDPHHIGPEDPSLGEGVDSEIFLQAQPKIVDPEKKVGAGEDDRRALGCSSSIGYRR